MTETPLIHTTKGNLPVAALQYSSSWHWEKTHVEFREVYKDSTGEVVKQNAHVFAFPASLQSSASE